LTVGTIMESQLVEVSLLESLTPVFARKPANLLAFLLTAEKDMPLTLSILFLIFYRILLMRQQSETC